MSNEVVVVNAHADGRNAMEENGGVVLRATADSWRRAQVQAVVLTPRSCTGRHLQA
ncbi:hypothetical protein [Kitasatospora sp. NPDC085879]|uniref:hypothetical protein n=1 Tax=Kitasatospora sp. NPDC085879 TaxID=3154769 RepID=UPI003424582A